MGLGQVDSCHTLDIYLIDYVIMHLHQVGGCSMLEHHITIMNTLSIEAYSHSLDKLHRCLTPADFQAMCSLTSLLEDSMGDRDNTLPQDDLEVEITNLDATCVACSRAFHGFSWSQPDITNPICASARDDVQLNGPLNQLPPTGTFMDWSFVSGVELAAGCLAIATPDRGSQATPSSRPPIAYCLHRFGIFVAVNDVAHKFWPLCL